MEQISDLLKNFIPEKELSMRSEISVEEKGVKYILKFRQKTFCVVYQIDGYVIDDKACKKCDKLILTSDDSSKDSLKAEIYVELKGSDVERAIEQLEQTLKHPYFSNMNSKLRWARIVSRRIPSNASKSAVEKAKRVFRCKYHCELRTVKSNNPETMK